MTWQGLAGYMYGLMLDARYKTEYYCNMADKWKGSTTDKLIILAKAMKYSGESTQVRELLQALEE